MKDLSYALGYTIGFKVLYKMHTLNIDLIQNHNLININEEDKLEYDRLNNEWQKSFKLSKHKKSAAVEFEELRNFSMKMEEKYLPPKLEVYLDFLDFNNEKSFRKGIHDYLWNSDYFHYNIESMKIINEKYYCKLEFDLR